ncbi:hypothetical protein T492DRAFT_2376 [Pavlovales sp. CCMP2436]|nr:hypothetical protein T492DRAFT_2376 [Pavlovales sp. CCMP2436]
MGKIVVHHDVPWGLVSAEQHVRALGALGAVGWVMANTDELVLRAQDPCTACQMWSMGDMRSLSHPVAVDITSRESVPLVGALRAGLKLVAELSPSPFPGARANGSWWFWLLSGACTLQICIVFELAVAKLHAFARTDAGLRASVPVIMLLVELWLCLLRFVLCTVDPFFSHFIVPFRETALVLSQASLLSTVSSSLFLVFFADAAASSGMASVTIGSRYKRRLLWFISTCIVLYVVVDVLSFIVLAPVDQGRFFIIFKILYLGFCFPAVTLVMAIVTSRRVHKALRAAWMPPRIVDRINTFMVRAIVLELLYLILGTGYLFAIVGAREWDIAWSALLHSLLITKSFQYVSAFKPLGVREWRGPLNTACSLAARALFKGGSETTSCSG